MTDEERRLVTYIKRTKLDSPSRKQSKNEQRIYIAAYLYYKFGWTEYEIGYILNRDHSTINKTKKLAYDRASLKDEVFLKYTHFLRKNFPYRFPKPEADEKDHRRSNKRVIVSISREQENKLLEYAREHKHLNQAAVIRELIDTYL